jgi:hypothetical protein
VNPKENLTLGDALDFAPIFSIFDKGNSQVIAAGFPGSDKTAGQD